MAATVWKGYVSFGLVSFPVRLFAAARPETVHFHMLHKKDLSRLKEVFFCAEEDKPVDRSEIVKGYEYEKGEYVVIDDADLKKIAPPTATTMEITQFVGANEVDPLFFEKSYYVAPEEAVSRPYTLLLNAMNETNHDAIAKMSMHGREHVVVLRPTKTGIILHTMYYVDEIHKSNQGAKLAKQTYNQKEMALAKQLIDTLEAPFKPEQFEDEYKKNVERLIEQKHKGHKITAVKQPKAAPVVDIMKALQRSLAQSGLAQSAGSSAKKRSAASKKKSQKRSKAAA